MGKTRSGHATWKVAASKVKQKLTLKWIKGRYVFMMWIGWN